MSGIIGSIIGGLGNFFGAQAAADGAKEAAQITGQYNTLATQKILDAQKEARLALEAAKARGIGYIDTGVGKYESTINPLLTPHPILMAANRGMTRQQQLGLDDLRRGISGRLASSGLRGAGRSGVAAGLDAERRYVLAARGANDADTISERRSAQNKADVARTGLASLYPQTGTAKANTEIGTGSQVANSYQQGGAAAGALASNTGSAYSNAANSIGNTWGNFATSTANLAGQGIGGLQASASSPNSGFGYTAPSGGGGGFDASGVNQWANEGYQGS